MLKLFLMDYLFSFINFILIFYPVSTALASCTTKVREMVLSDLFLVKLFLEERFIFFFFPLAAASSSSNDALAECVQTVICLVHFVCGLIAQHALKVVLVRPVNVEVA